MASHPLGRIVVAALLAAACSPPQLPPLVDRGEVETRSANGHIAAANAALNARKTSAETKAFVATLRGRIEAFNAAPSRADGATIATLGHAAGVVEQAVAGVDAHRHAHGGPVRGGDLPHVGANA